MRNSNVEGNRTRSEEAGAVGGTRTKEEVIKPVTSVYLSFF